MLLHVFRNTGDIDETLRSQYTLSMCIHVSTVDQQPYAYIGNATDGGELAFLLYNKEAIIKLINTMRTTVTDM